MWNISYTVVAAASRTANQYKFVSQAGVLAGSETNCFGINQSKGNPGDHIPAVKFGCSRLYMSEACSLGDFVGQSNATSGAGAIVTSGGCAFGQVLNGCDSGGFAQVTCFGVPTLIAL